MGKVVRVRRGIYRLVHYPVGSHEGLVEVWLWSEMAGVIAGPSALSLYNLSDALPSKIHLALPENTRERRLRVPQDVVIIYADIPKADRAWWGPVPMTSVPRTLNDCARHGLSPELLMQGARQALARGLVSRGELWTVEVALAPYGGLP